MFSTAPSDDDATRVAEQRLSNSLAESRRALYANSSDFINVTTQEIYETTWPHELMQQQNEEYEKAATAIYERLLESFKNTVSAANADFEFPLAPPLSVRRIKAKLRIVPAMGPIPPDDLD